MITQKQGESQERAEVFKISDAYGSISSIWMQRVLSSSYSINYFPIKILYIWQKVHYKKETHTQNKLMINLHTASNQVQHKLRNPANYLCFGLFVL